MSRSRKRQRSSSSSSRSSSRHKRRYRSSRRSRSPRKSPKNSRKNYSKHSPKPSPKKGGRSSSRDSSYNVRRRVRKKSTEEDRQKEQERKMQIRLAKARALKFEKEEVEEEGGTQGGGKPEEGAGPNKKILPAKEDGEGPKDEEKKAMEMEEMKEEEVKEEESKEEAREDDWLEADEEDENPPPVNPSTNNLAEHHEEDELDAYMRSIQKSSARQESFQLFQHQNQTFFQNVPVTEEGAPPQPIPSSQLITYEDIMNNNKGEEEELPPSENEDEFHKAFIEAMKNKPAPLPLPSISAEEGDEEIRKEEEGVGLRKEKEGQLDFLSEDEDVGEFLVKDMDEGDDFFAKQKKLADKKDLKPVDHSKVKYEPVRKNFYIESKEISAMSEEEVQNLRKELGDIKVRGLDCPKPIRNWYQCGLSDKILNILIHKKKFGQPFPIQCQSMPAIMNGKDVIGIAETGSGKTLAYLLPMFRHILDQRPLEEGDGPIALIMAPTRELSTQIYNECKTFCKALSLSVVCVYGGAGVTGQLSDLKHGAEIVVCTPGRMIDVLCTSNGKITNLRRVSYVVLDEADRMFDLGFEPQIGKIMSNIRPERQTVMFSATFPKNVENLAKKILTKPLEIVVGSRGQVCSNVEQIIEVREATSKFLRLLELLGEWSDKGSILIFVDRQIEADELFKELLKVGYLCLVLHGGQDQTDREYTILDFKKGVRNIMIATSICARGLDIKSLVLVINFSCPNHLEDYIHRIGRTGRAGNKGTAITFVTQEEQSHAPDLIKALEIGNNPIPKELIDLANEFRQKVEKGEARYYGNKNLKGSGYKFDEAEREKFKETRNMIKKQFDLELNLSDNEISDEEILKKKNIEDSAKQQKRFDNEILHLIKDPNTKAAALSAASKAALEKINQGGTSEEVLLAAKEAIHKILEQYKPTVNSSEEGLEKAIKVRDDILAREEENSEFITAELEINDYPLQARQKVIQKDYLGMIHDLTNCNITLRGSYFEPNKKLPLGQKKLYLHIESDNKYNVTSAYREIKRVLEETALSTLSGGHVGKYTI